MSRHADAPADGGARGIAHGETEDRGRVRSGPVAAEGTRRIQMTETGRQGDADIIVIEIPLRPAQVVGDLAQVPCQAGARLGQLVGHAGMLVAVLLVPARMGMRRAMEFAYTAGPHPLDSRPAQLNAACVRGPDT